MQHHTDLSGGAPADNAHLFIKGAREHNLKNVDLRIPRDQLVVFTGVSGSGKSSLAFDTLFAEGQRRYVESLSAYARQFLGQLAKPDVDYITGLSPAISIDQKSTSHNPRSTVGTVTEIYDHLRLLFARVGTPHCHRCGQAINPQTVEQIVDQVLAHPEGTRAQILAPLVRGKKGTHEKVLEQARKAGFVRVRVNGEVLDLQEVPPLDKNRKHELAIVVDRVVVRPDQASRLADSVATALQQAGGLVLVQVLGGQERPGASQDLLFSEHYACADCGTSLDEVAPRLFSFNSPFGACSVCHGLGASRELDPALLVPDPRKTLRAGALAPWARTGNPYYVELLTAVAAGNGFSIDVPWAELSPEARELVLHGTGEKRYRINQPSWYQESGFGYDTRFEGLIPNLQRRYTETTSERFKQELEGYMSAIPCEGCKGRRLRPEALAVRIQGASIADVTALSVREALPFFGSLVLTDRQRLIASQLLKEINARLGFLNDVGLDYLSLDRAANTLSGGEAQRIRLATQIGSGLQGVLYILDEPSIGLHQRDNERLLATLKRLRDLGNTLIVVEHDEDTIRAADHVVDIGPRAGVHGGQVVVQGTVEDVMACEASLTGQYLAGARGVPVPGSRRPGNGHFVCIEGASENNLRDIDVTLPLGTFICVTGVSGSGKSTLVHDVFHRHLQHHFGGQVAPPVALRSVSGLEHVDKVIVIDQAPIGRTPRSNPATYTGLFDHLREVFAMTTEARARGYQAGRFSFNVKGGRCEACKGEGMNVIEMHFLPDVYVPCEVCKGKRYNRETLEVRFKGRTIADVLDMTVEEALAFFEAVPRARAKLQTLYDVGLEYIKLGQAATTLSGGEAQRVKLAEQLARRATGRTLYILDEPSTGLSFYDVDKLLEVLNRLVDSGNTVLVIEHNLDIIKQADHLIDLGPDGGDRGGRLVATGAPEEVAACPASHTGRFLAPLLAGRVTGRPPAPAGPSAKARGARRRG
ncbi:MAG: excinuclease ABC subunit UvrA [Candidatus Sericytochromatia bacterium]|nr:excinuclease ABC subunit UvrA [Candidatus Sericytochromatia bacterium]